MLLCGVLIGFLLGTKLLVHAGPCMLAVAVGRRETECS